MSQPHINSLLLVGCIVCLSCIYLEGLDGKYVPEERFPILCQLRAWVLSLGFTLAYGSMFSKVWTIYRLTTRRKKDMKVLREWEMYVVMCLFLLVDVIVLTVWQTMDPLYRELETFAPEKPKDTEKDIELLPQLEHCSSRYLNVWLGVVFGYKGVLLLFGLLLAYETRSVKIKQVNDSRFVGMSIYNVVVLCIITAPVTLIIGSHQDASFAFVAVAILLSSFLAMGLIFVPKILEVMNNPHEGQESASLTNSSAGQQEEEQRHKRLTAENEDLKKQIAEKEEKIKELNRRLQAKTQQQRLLPPPMADESTPEKVGNNIQCNNNNPDPAVGTLVSLVPNLNKPPAEDNHMSNDARADATLNNANNPPKPEEQVFPEAYC